jgi:hypothetical protein
MSTPTPAADSDASAPSTPTPAPSRAVPIYGEAKGLQLFKLRPRIVEAVQAVEMTRVQAPSSGLWTLACAGEWITTDADGATTVYSDVVFKQRYAPLAEVSTPSGLADVRAEFHRQYSALASRFETHVIDMEARVRDVETRLKTVEAWKKRGRWL